MDIMRDVKDLAEAIKETDEYNEYVEAEEAVSIDNNAQQILMNIMNYRSKASFNPEAAKKLQMMEEMAVQNPITSRYIKAQEDIVNLCNEIAEKITQEVRFDFKSACSGSQGCC